MATVKAAVVRRRIGALALMLRDRPLTPPRCCRHDAFSLGTTDGHRPVAGSAALGLLQPAAALRADLPAGPARALIRWQRLHGGRRLARLDVASLVVAGTPEQRSDRLLVAGPLMMALGLAGVALLMPPAGADRLSGRRPCRRRHRRVLGIHRPEGHERCTGGRGGPPPPRLPPCSRPASPWARPLRGSPPTSPACRPD